VNGIVSRRKAHLTREFSAMEARMTPEKALAKNAVPQIAERTDLKPESIPSSPLPTRADKGVFRELSEPTLEGPDRMVFRSPFRSGLLHYTSWAVFSWLLAIFFWSRGETLISALAAMFGVGYSITTLTNVILGVPTAAFDRNTGLVTFGRRRRRKSYSLTGAAAIQLIQEGSWLYYKYYQMNLVWAHPEGARLCLTNTTQTSLDRLRLTARYLADFLGVPLVDQTQPPAHERT
jgi:hypothetical protein